MPYALLLVVAKHCCWGVQHSDRPPGFAGRTTAPIEAWSAFYTQPSQGDFPRGRDNFIRTLKGFGREFLAKQPGANVTEFRIGHVAVETRLQTLYSLLRADWKAEE